MPSIEIFRTKYQLPAVRDERFASLHQEAQRRRKRLDRPRRWIRRLTEEERLQEMQSLLENYYEIQRFLQQKSGELDGAFDQVANGVAKLFRVKIAELRDQEARRTVLANRSRGLGEEQLLGSLAQAEQHNRELAMILAQSVLLILKHVETARTAVRALSDNHDLQNEVFQQLSARVALYRDLWEYQQRAAQLQRDIGEISRVALEFNTILAEQLGPVYELVAEVARVDERVAASMAEIELLTAQLANNSSSVFAVGRIEDDPLMHMLVYRELTHDVVRELLAGLRGERLMADDEQLLPPGVEQQIEDQTVTVPRVLDNIERLIDAQLAGRLGNLGGGGLGGAMGGSGATANAGGSGPNLAIGAGGGARALCPVAVCWSEGFEAPRAVTASPDVVVVMARDSLHVLNAVSGAAMANIAVHGATACAVQGWRVAYAVGVEVFEVTVGSELGAAAVLGAAADPTPHPWPAQAEQVTALAFIDNGQRLVAALTNGMVRAVEDGALIAQVGRPVTRLLAAGERLLVQTNREELIGYRDGSEQWRLPGIRAAHVAEPGAEAATAGESASSEESAARLADVSSRVAVRDGRGYSRWVNPVDGSTIAGCAPYSIADREVLPWDLAPGADATGAANRTTGAAGSRGAAPASSALATGAVRIPAAIATDGPIIAVAPCGAERAALLTRGRRVYVVQRRD